MSRILNRFVFPELFGPTMTVYVSNGRSACLKERMFLMMTRLRYNTCCKPHMHKIVKV